MLYCLDTVGTIPDGVGFSYFDGTHIGWLVAFVAISIAMSVIYARANERVRRILRLVVGVLILADEAFKWITLVLGGNASVSYLPFHLCSINIMLIAIHMCKPYRWLGDFLYLICIPAAIIALLFPSWVALPPTNFMHIHSFTVHILLAVYPIMLTVGGDIRPSIKRLPLCLAILIGMTAVVYGINVWLDTNFMFLMQADPGNPLLWFEEHWGRHWYGFPVLLPVVFAVMYGIAYGVRMLGRKEKGATK